jgi:uncharacterized 2Fe-2S/4Fe-4S cluster protein (DUF4445 family)
MRLACQARALGNVKLYIPPESLSATQRLALEGEAVATAFDPSVRIYDIDIPPPGLADLRDDASRIIDVLTERGEPRPNVDLPALAELPGRLRSQRWSGRVIVSRHEENCPRLLGVLPTGAIPFGLAVDLGTTKIAAYLARLDTGQVVAQAGTMNPQTAFGEDVLSRISKANESSSSAESLREVVLRSIEGLADELCRKAACERRAIVEAVLVGNTAMHHLFLGLPVRQLGEAPYVAAVSDPLELAAATVGLELLAGARFYLPPIIAGFVGADHVAMLLAAGVPASSDTILALDIGTNTEISLIHGGELWSCSTASGPAFEGAHIRQGMRAAPGAIEHVRYLEGAFSVQTVGGEAPIGICGSGILDAISEARKAGLIDHRGALARGHPLVSHTDWGPTCVLVGGDDSESGKDVVFTRSDVNEIQLAKGAIRAGIEVLLGAAGIEASAIDDVVVAGAFGTYLDLDSAVSIGMLPPLPRSRYRQVGNGAGHGAIQLLVSRGQRLAAHKLAREVRYVELTVHPDFPEIFMQSMTL